MIYPPINVIVLPFRRLLQISCCCCINEAFHAIIPIEAVNFEEIGLEKAAAEGWKTLVKTRKDIKYVYCPRCFEVIEERDNLALLKPKEARKRNRRFSPEPPKPEPVTLDVVPRKYDFSSEDV